MMVFIAQMRYMCIKQWEGIIYLRCVSNSALRKIMIDLTNRRCHLRFICSFAKDLRTRFALDTTPILHAKVIFGWCWVATNRIAMQAYTHSPTKTSQCLWSFQFLHSLMQSLLALLLCPRYINIEMMKWEQVIVPQDEVVNRQEVFFKKAIKLRLNFWSKLP